MAIKTQLRLNQMTASFGVAVGQINDGGFDNANKAALADIPDVDLSGSLSYLASSIRRIHGGASFSNQAEGAFSTNITVAPAAAGASITVGDASANDHKLVFDGNAADYYIGLDDTDDDLKIGGGQTVGSSTNLTINSGDQGIVVGADVLALGALMPEGDTAADDKAAVGYTAVEGIIITGQGSTSDVTIKNDADATVLTIATGTTNVDVVGDLRAANFQPDGDTAASDPAAIGYTAAEGIIITGQGSTNDVTIKNDADVAVVNIPTGGTAVNFVGHVSGSLLKPGSDTSAGLGAALGYTTQEGIIITGQGTTADVTIKNDADGLVMEIPTGTTNAVFHGDLEIGNDLTVEGNDIKMNGGSTIITMAAAKTTFAGNLQLGATGIIQNSAGEDCVTINGDQDVTIGRDLDVTGDLTVTGNDIKGSGGTAVTFSGVNTSLAGDLTVVGNDIKGSANNTQITFAGANGVQMPLDLEVLGDLYVRGTEHIIDVDNLRIKDPVIAFGAGAQTVNHNGGMALISGSTGAGAASLKSDMVFGRVANNTWGAGVMDTQSGSITSLAGMGLADLRVRELQITGSANHIAWDSDWSGMVINASASLLLTSSTGLVAVQDDCVLSFNGATNTMKISANGGADMNINAPGDIRLNPGGGDVIPDANNGASLGNITNQYSDLFLFEGGVINWDNGDITLTQAGNVLTLAGGSLVSNVNVSAKTLTTSAAQNLAILQGAGANVDIGAFDLRASTVTADSLTSGRVPFASTAGLLIDDSDFAFATDTLTVTKLGAYEQAGAVDFSDEAMTNVNIDSGAIDGAIIGAANPEDATVDDLILGANSGVIYLAGDASTEKISCNNGNGVNVMAAGDITLKAGGADIALVQTGDHSFSQFNRAGAGEAYLNFSTNDGSAMTAGSGGFGVRNNAGTMQFKNSGGSWDNFGGSASASKTSSVMSASIGAGTRVFGGAGKFNFSAVVGQEDDMVDVYVNGQMMLSGGTVASITNDYVVDITPHGDAAADLRFNFDLADDDVVTITVR